MTKLLIRTVLLGLVCAASSSLRAQAFAAAPEPAAQTASAPTGWARVQAQAPGTALHIKARTHNIHCRFQSADAETLTCLAAAKPETYQRADILSIKVPHRIRSAAIGLAAGAGVGAIIGAASGGSNGGLNILSRGDIAAILAVPGAFLGLIIGALTDFTASTIYRV